MQPDINAYIAVMDEIKRRDLVATSFLSGKTNTHFKACNVELGVLQLRLILELIALASLAANKEIFQQNQRKFSDHWHPSKILRDVSAINPGYFPKPIVEVKSFDPKVKVDLQPRQPDFMTSDELIEVHGRCGDLLHASNPYGKARQYERFEGSAPKWLERVRNLLNVHEVRLLNDDERFYLVHMHEQGREGVHMYTFQRADA